MPAATVVEAVDVLEQGSRDLVACRPGVTPDQFCFESFEESFNGGIVVTVTLAAHGHCEAQFP